MLQVLSYPVVAGIFAVGGFVCGYLFHDALKELILKLIEKIKGKV